MHLPELIGLTAVTFFISRLTNIDPVLAVVGDKATQAAYDSAYQALGLDQPLIFQYFIYLGRLVTGDALLTQRAISRQRVGRGGDDLLPVEQTQPSRRDGIAAACSPLGRAQS